MVGEAADREFLKMPMFFGLALLIIMAVQYWSFRSLQGMLLPLLTGILSVIWSLGLMGLLNVHLDPLNTTTPILVLAVASGHAIQILKRYYEEYTRLVANGATPHDANRAAVVESIVRVGPVMMVAGLDRRPHVLLARQHRHPDGAALRRLRRLRRAGDDDHRDDGDTGRPHDAASADAARVRA